MDTVTLYLVATVKLAVSLFHKRDGGRVPMLNDHLGERLHDRLEDAVACGLDIAESLDQKSPDIAIVHVTYALSLHEELAGDGQINGESEKDFFGKRLWKLTPEAARRLNSEARFTMEVYPLPLEIKAVAAMTSSAIN